MRTGAVLSDCGRYRYTLARGWDRTETLPILVWVMLNPSTADDTKNDPTIRRCITFADRWGYGGILVLNLFAARATNPADLTSFADPVGPQNDLWLFEATKRKDVICAWGASTLPRYWRRRPAAVLERLRGDGAALHHLGLTKDGHPRHPLYLRGDTVPTRWAA